MSLRTLRLVGLTLVCALGAAGCTRITNCGAAGPAMHFRVQAMPGPLDGVVAWELLGGDDYAVSYVYSPPGPGVLRLRAESEIGEPRLDLDVYTDGSVPIATTYGSAQPGPGVGLATWLEGGETWVVLRQPWKDGVKRGVRLSARFSPGERLPEAPVEQGKSPLR